jgi:curved DNA-binding protein CbpA
MVARSRPGATDGPDIEPTGVAMTADRTDPYTALGLAPTATRRQIRHAYRTLLRQHHPDTRPLGDPIDSAASDTTLQQVIAAYAILGDQARRGGQDRSIHSHPANAPTRPHPGTLFARNALDQPPVQAGPVRWHGSLAREVDMGMDLGQLLFDTPYTTRLE